MMMTIGEIQISACECNGHATECRFDDQAKSVCVHCTGNTDGQFCEKCKTGFYRTANMLPHDDCIPCKCGKDGASGDCVPDNSFDRRVSTITRRFAAQFQIRTCCKSKLRGSHSRCLTEQNPIRKPVSASAPRDTQEKIARNVKSDIGKVVQAVSNAAAILEALPLMIATPITADAR